MDTGRLKRFSIEARTILMQGVKNRLQALGFDLKTGKTEELPQGKYGLLSQMDVTLQECSSSKHP